MQTFKFRAIETVTKYIEIEAETKEDAFDIADELLYSGEIDFDKDIDYHAEIELA